MALLGPKTAYGWWTGLSLIKENRRISDISRIRFIKNVFRKVLHRLDVKDDKIFLKLDLQTDNKINLLRFLEAYFLNIDFYHAFFTSPNYWQRISHILSFFISCSLFRTPCFNIFSSHYHINFAHLITLVSRFPHAFIIKYLYEIARIRTPS